MPIIFSSKAHADVLMLQAPAQALLQALGKDAATGIWTAAELPAAIAALQSYSTEQDALFAAAAKQQASSPDDEGHGNTEVPASQAVRPSARHYPLLQLLQAAKQTQNFVTWQTTR